MNCPQCGTPNEETAKFCSHCGTALVTQSAVTPPAVPASSQPATALPAGTVKIISIIAAAMLALGFFLPWLSKRSYRGYELGDDDVFNINGIEILKEIFKGDFNGDATIPVIIITIFLVSIPLFSIIYIIQKLNPKPASVRMGIFCTSMAGFLPLLIASLQLFMGNSSGLFMIFGGLGMGIGSIFMIIGALLLFIETIYIIAQKTDNKTLGGAWVKAAIAGAATALLHLLMIELVKNGENDSMATMYLLFTIGILAIGFNVAVNIHKSQDLGGTLGFRRSIAFSLIYGLVTGIGCYFVLLIEVPNGELIYGGIFMVLVALNALLAFIFGAARALSLPNIKEE